jgi:hypothetical protein
MPVLLPLTNPTMLGDLAQEAAKRCENRLDTLTTDGTIDWNTGLPTQPRAHIWVRDALIEICSDGDLRDDFDELEEWGNPFTLSPGIQEYAFSNIVPVGDWNLSTLSVFLWVDAGINTQRIQLRPTHYQDADRGTATVGSTGLIAAGTGDGQPSEWYRFGDTIGFNPIPNAAFQVNARIQRGHPIQDDTLPYTTILLLRDWHDILIWAAVERGYLEIGALDKAEKIHVMLYGDPRYPNKPGLVSGRKKRRKREAFRQSGSLRPIIRPYGWGQ